MTTTAWCSVDTKADCSTIVAKYLRTRGTGASQAPVVLVADRLPQERERVELSGTNKHCDCYAGERPLPYGTDGPRA